MSGFTGAALGVSAAATVGSAIAGASASSDAAGISAAQAAANAKLFKAQQAINDQLLQQGQGQNDQLLQQSQGQNDQLLQGATKYGQQKIDKATDYGRSQLRGALRYGKNQLQPYNSLGRKGNAALGRYLGFTPQYNVKPPVAPPKNAPAKDRAAYKTKLAQYNQNKAAYLRDQRGKSDFGDYNRPYTRADLMRDPVYRTELNENVRAWDQSAASRGSLMSGNTVAGLRDLTAAGIQRGYDRDWNQRNRKYSALTGLSNMGQNVAGQLTNLRTGIAGAQVANQHWGTNALLQNNQWGVGNQLQNNQWGVGNRVNNNQWGTKNRVQNNQWATDGATGANTAGADARANGAISQGNAWANGIDDVGYLAMKYGRGGVQRRHERRISISGVVEHGGILNMTPWIQRNQNSLADMDAQLQLIEGQRSQNALADPKMQAYEREADTNNRFAARYAQGGSWDDPGFSQEMYGIDPTSAAEHQKAYLENKKLGAQAGKTDYETAEKKLLFMTRFPTDRNAVLGLFREQAQKYPHLAPIYERLTGIQDQEQFAGEVTSFAMDGLEN